jgi:hypothetical protein
MNYQKVIDWLDEDDAEFIYSSLKNRQPQKQVSVPNSEYERWYLTK